MKKAVNIFGLAVVFLPVQLQELKRQLGQGHFKRKEIKEKDLIVLNTRS